MYRIRIETNAHGHALTDTVFIYHGPAGWSAESNFDANMTDFNFNNELVLIDIDI